MALAYIRAQHLVVTGVETAKLAAPKPMNQNPVAKRYPMHVVVQVVMAVTLGLLLLLTVFAIVARLECRNDLMAFMQSILSWPVVASGLALGFKEQIKGVLSRWAR